MFDITDYLTGKGVIISRVSYKHENTIETAIGGIVNTAGECVSLAGFGGFDTHTTGKINNITLSDDVVKVDCEAAVVELTEISVKDFESSEFKLGSEKATHEWVEAGQLWYFNTAKGSYYPQIGGDYELEITTPQGVRHTLSCAKSERVDLSD